MINNNSEEILNAISDLKKIFSNRHQLYSHYFSGDKDTMIEAYNTIVNDKYRLGDFYSHESPQIKEYQSKYQNEISKCYQELVSFGKEILNKFTIAESHLNEIKKIELDYMTIEEKREYLINQILNS